MVGILQIVIPQEAGKHTSHKLYAENVHKIGLMGVEINGCLTDLVPFILGVDKASQAKIEKSSGAKDL